MNFLGYPTEIWLAAIVSVLIRLKYNRSTTVLGSITTVSVAIFAGVFMHEPLITLMGLSDDWKIFTAIVIALSAENFMKNIMIISDDRDFVREWIVKIISKGPKQ
jgi:hypothetical protein